MIKYISLIVLNPLQISYNITNTKSDGHERVEREAEGFEFARTYDRDRDEWYEVEGIGFLF